ncbi:hypothetical protein FACS1894125_1730 [Actinomycetota bacterium]|nr:hypothetical protein FACS1894125_1730 [Actinomycetota bacterium]
MLEIPRRITSDTAPKIHEYFEISNVLYISGPNCCGKTYVVQQFLTEFDADKVVTLSGDDMMQRITLMNANVDELLPILKNREILFIDDAERVPKALDTIDAIKKMYPELKIIAAFSTREVEDFNQIRVYPVSFYTLKQLYPSYEDSEILNEVMIYGALPEVLGSPTLNEKQAVLSRVVNSDMLKDVFELEKITHSKSLMDLLYFLALKINKTLSINEISEHVNINPKTVKRYIKILEKHYVIHEHIPYKKKIRTEVSQFSRYYFYDMGVRNALINNFAPFNMRDDVENIWVNFMIMERHKHQELNGISHTLDYESFFWELWGGKAIDLVEVDKRGEGSNINAFNFGFSNVVRTHSKVPTIFTNNYPCAKYMLVSQTNFNDFIG